MTLDNVADVRDNTGMPLGKRKNGTTVGPSSAQRSENARQAARYPLRNVLASGTNLDPSASPMTKDGINWPKSWTADDIAWVKRQIQAEPAGMREQRVTHAVPSLREALERLVLAVEGHADVEPTETDGVAMKDARRALVLQRFRDDCPHPDSARTSNKEWIVCTQCGWQEPNR